MKRTYHLCWSGGDEVLCRTREDYIHCIICLCIAAHETGSRLLAYCIMSNHVHICARSEDTKRFITAFRYSYSRYFNSKYQRRGRLGERSFFIHELDGLYHTLAAIAYILRNPLHHGICKTPFEYEFSSITGAFTKELGYATYLNGTTEHIALSLLPSRHRLPPGVKISSDGLPLSETIIDVADIEHMFSTARSYLYYMNRISGEEWEKEQTRDKPGSSPIKLEDIENGVHASSIREMLINENGRGRNQTMQDIQLCSIIDDAINKCNPGQTVYTLSPKQVIRLEASMLQKHHISKEQLSRCLSNVTTQENRR